ncbi:hypothetical protein [Vulcanisaeta distributa]|uniref:hypothetical protein n=1 Tax=Vulcanisaeta distributa TaxID=164451 RepID=UPI0011E5465B|nr:hypothetical protein [Vulcanisaeta distributa]
MTKLVKLCVGLKVFTVVRMFSLLFLALNYFHVNNIHVPHTYHFTVMMYMGILTPFIVRGNPF